MRKILIFQHVANEVLGTFHSQMKARGFRLRYINFERNPDTRPSLAKYNGLILLGGNMSVYESDLYSHIAVEMELIEQALNKEIPVLGVCLGAQLLAQVLGAKVRKSPEKEMGWYDLHLNPEAKTDPLFSHFKTTEKVFQMHGDTFDVPASCTHLAWSKKCPGQVFRYRHNVYGLQPHLEADAAMINRWNLNHQNSNEMKELYGNDYLEKMKRETDLFLPRSIEISTNLFSHFLDLFGEIQRSELLGSDHAKPLK